MTLVLHENHYYNRFLPDLIKQASKSTVSYKHAASIVRGKDIFAIQQNYHDLKKNTFIHAEISAIRSLRNSAKNFDVIVIRLNKKSLGNSRPCKNCLSALKKIGVRRVYYSITGGDILCENVENMNTDHQSRGHSWKHC